MPDKGNKAKILPQNNEAEQALLGCVLIDEFAPMEIISALDPDDFYSPAHKAIFTAMRSVYSRNVPTDIVTVAQELESSGAMQEAGGIGYITTLTDVVPSAANYKHYLEIVRTNSLRRKLISAAGRISERSFVGDNPLQYAEQEIFVLGEADDRGKLEPISVSVKEAIDVMEKIERDPTSFKGIPSGFSMLDAITNGFHGGDLIILAARPGQGKTSIGMNFIQSVALNDKRKNAAGETVPFGCAVFSLEMPSVQLAQRMLCSVAKVNMTQAKSGTLGDAEWRRLLIAQNKLANAHIYVDDKSNTTPMEIISKCRKLQREKKLDMVMIDYLQLMSVDRRVESRQLEISEITRSLKIAAKELNVPILLLSQLSRKVEGRTDKRPVMSDLRESGAIEQDADIILFIYREHDASDMSVSEDVRNKVELIIAKHRNGETGKVDLRWRGEYVSFEQAERHTDKNMASTSYEDNGSAIPAKTKEELLSVNPDDESPI